MEILRKTLAQARLCLKLFVRDRITVSVLILSMLTFLLCMSDFSRGADELSSIPIGLIDGDRSTQSEELVDRVGGNEALSVKSGTYQELLSLLENGDIRCILEIKEGYGQAVSAGEYRALVNVYHEEGDNVATLITDIVAGEMMYDICQAHAYLAYGKLAPGEKEKFSRQEYEAYAASLLGNEDFDFAFEFRFLDGKGGERREGLKNSLFYRQAVAAVAAVLLTLVMMAPLSCICLEGECGVRKRKRLSGMGGVCEAFGSLLACALLAFLPSAVFAFCVASGVGNFKKFFPIFWTSAFFSVIMALIYYILAKAARGLFVYQVAGTFVLAVSGICGFLSVVDGVLFPKFPGWFSLIPNCAYLRCFTWIL
ncbi:MAG: ABC transporter permease [Lachnospiraceae bacterium]|nr:ABC transporter permease [Lachnospiraceae bacterium]